MTNFVFNKAAAMMLDHTHAEALDMESDTIRVMLVGSGYTPDRDDDYVGSGAGTPGGEEITATGYTGGHQGAGRHTIGSIAVTEDDTNDLAKVDGADPAAWDPLGNTTNDTVTYVILMRDGTTDDSDALLIACYDTVSSGTFPFTTNGGSFTWQWHTNGMFRVLTNPT